MNNNLIAKINNLYNFLSLYSSAEEYNDFFRKFAGPDQSLLGFKSRHPVIYNQYEEELKKLFKEDKIKYFRSFSAAEFFRVKYTRNNITDYKSMEEEILALDTIDKFITLAEEQKKSQGSFQKLIKYMNNQGFVLGEDEKEELKKLFETNSSFSFENESESEEKIKVFEFIIKNKKNEDLSFFKQTYDFIQSYYWMHKQHVRAVEKIRKLKDSLNMEDKEKLFINEDYIEGVLEEGDYLYGKKVYEHPTVLDAETYMEKFFSNKWGRLRKYYEQVEKKLQLENGEAIDLDMYDSQYDVVFNNEDIIVILPHTTTAIQYFTRTAVNPIISDYKVDEKIYYKISESQCTSHIPGITGTFKHNEFRIYAGIKYVMLVFIKKPYKTLRRISYAKTDNPNNIIVARYNIETREIIFYQNGTTNLLNNPDTAITKETINDEFGSEEVKKALLEVDNIIIRNKKQNDLLAQNNSGSDDTHFYLSNGNPLYSQVALSSSSFSEVLVSLDSLNNEIYENPIPEYIKDQTESIEKRKRVLEEKKRKGEIKDHTYKSKLNKINKELKNIADHYLYISEPGLLPIDSSRGSYFDKGIKYKEKSEFGPKDQDLFYYALEKSFYKDTSGNWDDYLKDPYKSWKDDSFYSVENFNIFSNFITKSLFYDLPDENSAFKKFISSSLAQSNENVDGLEKIIGKHIAGNFSFEKLLKSNFLKMINNKETTIQINENFKISLDKIFQEIFTWKMSSLSLNYNTVGGKKNIDFIYKAIINKDQNNKELIRLYLKTSISNNRGSENIRDLNLSLYNYINEKITSKDFEDIIDDLLVGGESIYNVILERDFLDANYSKKILSRLIQYIVENRSGLEIAEKILNIYSIYSGLNKYIKMYPREYYLKLLNNYNNNFNNYNEEYKYFLNELVSRHKNSHNFYKEGIINKNLIKINEKEDDYFLSILSFYSFSESFRWHKEGVYYRREIGLESMKGFVCDYIKNGYYGSLENADKIKMVCERFGCEDCKPKDYKNLFQRILDKCFSIK